MATKVDISLPSKKMRLNKEDMLKLSKSLLLGLVGFTLAFCVDAIPNIDFGMYSQFVYSMSPVVANLIRKWFPGA